MLPSQTASLYCDLLAPPDVGLYRRFICMKKADIVFTDRRRLCIINALPGCINTRTFASCAIQLILYWDAVNRGLAEMSPQACDPALIAMRG
jgi:hypothetical protein